MLFSMMMVLPRRGEVMGGQRKQRNEELRALYSSLRTIRMIKSRRMRWAGHVARMGEKPEGKTPLGRQRHRWVDLGEIGWGGVDWIDLAQVESSCECSNELSGSVKCWQTIKCLSSSAAWN
jgi:hypothetical protein